MASQNLEGWIRTGVTIGTIVVGLAMGWQALSSRVAVIEDRDAEQNKRIEQLMADRQDDRNALTEIRTDLRYIRDTLTRLEKNGGR